ncbi:cysteine proteinase inhibitor 6 isoform X2 [Jatropha curcas]|uniref:cysteine proteinase inhibitor 6 isoform X2 n=1 Tax=Jatropha curcas TaxID=180498 RepID=UPI001894E7BA|nr:cysteine proteinase inhibitor 6 isoform X2 [Jatropha curcas]
MRSRTLTPLSSTLLLFIVILFSLSSFVIGESGFCGDKMARLGGVREVSANSVEIDGLARFAVEEHNKKENALLEFARVVKAKEQVVAGTLHHLTIEAIEAGKKKLYEAKIWVKPWLNFKELQEFKHAGDVDGPDGGASSFTSSDLGVKRDGHGPGWREVPAHDPAVQDAANHAVKTIQQRSNSLFPYELQEIVHAKAESIVFLLHRNYYLGFGLMRVNIKIRKTIFLMICELFFMS